MRHMSTEGRRESEGSPEQDNTLIEIVAKCKWKSLGSDVRVALLVYHNYGTEQCTFVRLGASVVARMHFAKCQTG